jgi:hypothetical protein
MACPTTYAGKRPRTRSALADNMVRGNKKKGVTKENFDKRHNKYRNVRIRA